MGYCNCNSLTILFRSFFLLTVEINNGKDTPTPNVPITISPPPTITWLLFSQILVSLQSASCSRIKPPVVKNNRPKLAKLDPMIRLFFRFRSISKISIIPRSSSCKGWYWQSHQSGPLAENPVGATVCEELFPLLWYLYRVLCTWAMEFECGNTNLRSPIFRSKKSLNHFYIILINQKTNYK